MNSEMDAQVTQAGARSLLLGVKKHNPTDRSRWILNAEPRQLNEDPSGALRALEDLTRIFRLDMNNPPTAVGGILLFDQSLRLVVDFRFCAIP